MNALQLLRLALAAAEPQPTGERHFDFYFWRKLSHAHGLSVGAIDATVVELKRIVAPAQINGPMPVKLFPGVPGACRFKVRVVTHDARKTIAQLVNKLPAMPEFVAFCNNYDADDSVIEPTDKAGIRAMAVELLEEF